MNYRESEARSKHSIFFLISPKKNPLGKLFSETIFKSSSEALA